MDLQPDSPGHAGSALRTTGGLPAGRCEKREARTCSLSSPSASPQIAPSRLSHRLASRLVASLHQPRGSRGRLRLPLPSLITAYSSCLPSSLRAAPQRPGPGPFTGSALAALVEPSTIVFSSHVPAPARVPRREFPGRPSPRSQAVFDCLCLALGPFGPAV